MNLYLRSMPPDSAETWLEMATRGLADDSRASIAREIHAHYQEALHEAHDAGMPLKEARDRALASLGDPREARRGFLRTHLTRSEARAIRLEHSWLFTGAFFLWLGLFLYGALVENHFSPKGNNTFPLFLCYLYAIPLLRRFLGDSLKTLLPGHAIFVVLYTFLAVHAALRDPALTPWFVLQGACMPLLVHGEMVLLRKLARRRGAR